jgi:hypothetical protein
LTFFAPFFGYKVVHTYERYAWIPVAIIFFIVLGLSAKHMDLGSVVSPIDASGGVLSFGAAVFGFGIGWSSYAAGEWEFLFSNLRTWYSAVLDYTVHMEESASSTMIFLLNYLGKSIHPVARRGHPSLHLYHAGLNTPLILIESLGAGMATLTRQDWQDAFLSGGTGGLLGASLSSTGGFGKFCLVIVRRTNTFLARQ